MTFRQWILSEYNDITNPRVNGAWGWQHIFVLILSIAIIITLALVFRKKSEKARKIVIYVLVGIILFFEIARRVINIYKMTEFVWHDVLYTLLPRPWCAIACWSLIIATIFRKQYMFNFASFSALLCALIFFAAYPSAGFTREHYAFENIYSIATHSLLLITSITMITLKITKFEYKNIWKELICLAVIVVYSFLEIYVLKISSDPLYFMPDNEVMEILGVSFGVYLPIYLLFMVVYINVFYLINDWKTVKNKFSKKK